MSETLSQVLEGNAEVFSSVVEDRYGVALTHDREGVLQLERFLNTRREDLAGSALTGLVDLAGSFLGECIAAVHGGEWIDGPEHPHVQLEPGRLSDPFWMVESHLRYRAAYSVTVLFDAIGATSRVRVGGLYSVPNDDGTYAVLKVLAADHIGVHLRRYGNVFVDPPAAVASAELSTAVELERLKDEPSTGMAIGHFPLAHQGFWEMGPVLIQAETVEDEELEGYRIWLGVEPGS